MRGRFLFWGERGPALFCLLAKNHGDTGTKVVHVVSMKQTTANNTFLATVKKQANTKIFKLVSKVLNHHGEDTAKDLYNRFMSGPVPTVAQVEALTKWV